MIDWNNLGERIYEHTWWDEAEPTFLPDFVCPNCEVKGLVELVGFDDLDSKKEVRFCNNCRATLREKKRC